VGARIRGVGSNGQRGGGSESRVGGKSEDRDMEIASRSGSIRVLGGGLQSQNPLDPGGGGGGVLSNPGNLVGTCEKGGVLQSPASISRGEVVKFPGLCS